MKKLLFSFFKLATRLFQGKNLGAWIPGLRPSHRFLLNALKPKGVVEIIVFGKTLFVDTRDSGEANEIILGEQYSPYETEIFRSLVNPGMTIADIGAHIGYFTIMAADLVGPSGRVYAFEPDPKNFALLSRSISANQFVNVVSENKAVSNKAGIETLFLDRSNLGNMSFSRQNIPADSSGGNVSVPTVTLDEYFSGLSLDIIKIDVQGAEGRVFECSKDTLHKVQFVLAEFWPFGLRNVGTDPRAFLEMFVRAGFSLYLLNEGAHTMKKKTIDELLLISGNRPEGKGWANILCVRDSPQALLYGH
ncbi:MAG: FkbM family methyltransferase [Parcubacteria group bacterium Gr01-1014_17]|nr:MAG: FkbM family methyltransferase [Parcubacteria group bacterium Gr01-1014_17]